MRNGPIAKPNASIAASISSGDAPSSSMNSAWREYCSIMRLPMNHHPDTGDDRGFFSVLPSFIVVANASLAVAAPRDLEQLHDIGRAEEMCADDVLWAAREAAMRTTSSIRCSSRNCARLHRLVGVRNTCSDAGSSNRLDHDIGLRDLAVRERRLQERHACVELVLRDAFLDLPAYVADARDARIECTCRARAAGECRHSELIEIPRPSCPRQSPPRT